MTKVSIVITGKNRTELLNRSLFATCRWQQYDKSQVELVMVDDVSDDAEKLRDVLREYAKYFYKTTLVRMDKRLSKIPVIFNNPALGINLAVKAAENEIILKTDPEGLPLTETVMLAAEMFHPSLLWFFAVRMLVAKENETFTVEKQYERHPRHLFETLFQGEDLWHINERRRLPYWFGAVFSRTEFMNAGGMDEEFLRGFAGEDDEWAERMLRRGVQWRWSDRLKIVHQHHGDENRNWIHTPAHATNIERLNHSRAQATMVANVGHEWGADSCIVGKEVFS